MRMGFAQGFEDQDLSPAMREPYICLIGERLPTDDGRPAPEMLHPGEGVVWVGWSEMA